MIVESFSISFQVMHLKVICPFDQLDLFIKQTNITMSSSVKFLMHQIHFQSHMNVSPPSFSLQDLKVVCCIICGSKLKATAQTPI